MSKREKVRGFQSHVASVGDQEMLGVESTGAAEARVGVLVGL